MWSLRPVCAVRPLRPIPPLRSNPRLAAGRSRKARPQGGPRTRVCPACGNSFTIRLLDGRRRLRYWRRASARWRAARSRSRSCCPWPISNRSRPMPIPPTRCRRSPCRHRRLPKLRCPRARRPNKPCTADIYEPLACPNCNGGGSGGCNCLPPPLPNGQYPDDWMWGCGQWPYANGPGTCDDWKVGSAGTSSVDGMMFRPGHAI